MTTAKDYQIWGIGGTKASPFLLAAV